MSDGSFVHKAQLGAVNGGSLAHRAQVSGLIWLLQAWARAEMGARLGLLHAAEANELYCE